MGCRALESALLGWSAERAHNRDGRIELKSLVDYSTAEVENPDRERDRGSR